MTPTRSFTRSSILARLRQTIADGRPIIGAGASVGIVARCAEAGGADLIIVYSTGRSRIMGLPTTPMGHSNPLTLAMYDEIENVVDGTPIIGGAEATDLTYRRLPKLIDAFQSTGFDGVINFPSVGNRPEFANTRAHTNQGLSREFEMFQLCREADFFTMGYAYTHEQARLNAAAGVDVQVAHAGWTSGGDLGAGTGARSLEEAAHYVQEIAELSWSENPDVIVLAHGGAIADPEDTTYLYEQTDAQGFVGASSIERLPIERAITETVRQFKDKSLSAAAKARA